MSLTSSVAMIKVMFLLCAAELSVSFVLSNVSTFVYFLKVNYVEYLSINTNKAGLFEVSFSWWGGGGGGWSI